ncbi:uncharacterized protein LOC143468964 isoform X2 [Clavelina lepadiformis]|uniref:uncharacterized protein LOC143468964 isoform X2 n=1 Tax=Clavelina lepadiformis TaxID=159417 RepID=UPI00404274F9
MQLRDYKDRNSLPSLGNMTSTLPADLKGASTISFTEHSSLVAGRGSVYSHSDESSSDDELREPMAESPPNLSDEESLDAYRNESSINKETSDVMAATTFISPPNQIARLQEGQRKVVTRTSSRSNFSLGQRTSNHSQPSMFYQAAKPRPPPRKPSQKKIVAANSKTLSEISDRNFAPKEPTTGAQIVTLPYVSRGTAKVQLRRGSFGNGINKNDVYDVTIKENVPLERTNNLVASFRSTSRDRNHLLEADTSPTRATVSSGYSSSSSVVGSSSLSPSTSNASSASFRSSAPPCDLPEKDTMTTRERTESASRGVSEADVALTLLDEEEEVPKVSSEHDEDDVFPITEWAESEYKRIQETLRRNKTQLSKEETDSGKQINNDQLQNRPSSLGNNASTSSFKDVTVQRPRSAYVIPSSPEQSKQSFVGRNSVCMVEESTPHTMKQRSQIASSYATSRTVMMRFPGMTRSKKDAASRNSRAFAMQAKSQLDLNPSSPEVENFPQSKSTSAIEPDKDGENDVRRAASLSPKSFAPSSLERIKKELSASLANLDQLESNTYPKSFNTVSGATGRHMSERSAFFHDENRLNSSKVPYTSTQSIYTGSTWSLNPASQESHEGSQVERKPSLRNRLKGAFSFQNIRKAISMERLNEDERSMSSSHCYLNELGEDISNPKQKTVSSDMRASGNKLHKASSISSILSTVRMRKRKSRERRALKARNTIAVDPKQIPEYESETERIRPVSAGKNNDVGRPGHFRPIGKVLQMNGTEGTLLVEMTRPSSGPVGFCLARRKGVGSVYISSLSDSYPDKMYAGLMRLGDEITEINGVNVEQLSLDQIYDLILENERIILLLKPSQVHSV